MASGAVVTLSVPLLRPDRQAIVVLAVLTFVMTAVLLVSLVIRWDRLPRTALLVFPVLVWVAVVVVGAAEPGLALPYAPLFVLTFTYTGLTQSARVNLLTLGPGACAYAVALGSWTASFGVRFVIVSAVWALLSQLLVGLTARQRLLTEALRAAAYTDGLTGLANRRALDLRLETLTSRDTLLLCDLDHFKALNDRDGHGEGDRVLAAFGAALRDGLRDEDFPARYGGEEFAVLLPGTTSAQAQAVLSRLRSHWAMREPGVTFSAGIADNGTGAAALLLRADRALYAAKAAGRNTDRVAGQHAPQRPLIQTAPVLP